MMRILRPTVLALVVVLCACGSDAKPAPRGVVGTARGERPAPVEEPAPEEPAEEPPGDEPMRRSLPSPFQPGPGDLAAKQQPAQAPQAAPAEEAPERDLGEELAALARTPGCLDLAAAATQPGGRLAISVTAFVTPSGRITRASVSAPGQPAAALRCTESRIVSAGLRGPVPGAPTSVSGQTTIEVVAAAPVRTAPATQAPASAVQAPPPSAPENRTMTTSNYTLGGGAKPDVQAGAP